MTAYLLNLADLALTLYALAHGGVELNPLLQNPAVMVAWKTVGVGVGVLCWWLSTRPEQTAKIGLRLCTAVYAVLFVYHLFFIGGSYL